MGSSQPRLSLETLGQLVVSVDGAPIRSLRSTKATALLLYLAETDRSHRRSALAGLLWPDRSESAARNNLRQTLTALRKVIPDHLDVDGDAIGLTGDVAIDTRPITADGYRGPFLDGFAVADSDLFESWIQRVRAGHELVGLSVLRNDAERALTEGRIVDGLSAANRILEIQPWNEEAHRLVMQLLAADGRPDEAVEQYDRCVETLWEELGARPDPATEAVLAAIEAPDAEADTTLTIPPTALRGRDVEVETLAERLVGDRLVTLVGPGGIGKTRLAVAIAERAADRHADGSIAISLAGVTESERVAPVIASACGIQIVGTDPKSRLASGLADRELLLLIDNAEQVASAVAETATAILERGPRMAILVTSRSPLDVGIGHVHWMRGLDVSTGRDSPAVQLFEDHARRIVEHPRIDDDVIDLCRTLDGFPLAIELAARRIGELGAVQILESLADGVLHTTMPDVADRHRSMDTVLAAAWEGLDGSLAETMSRLSVFRGGFDGAAASAVAGADARALARLASRSLVFRRGDRFQIHELIRQYAASRLADPGMHRRHALHYLDVLAEAEALMFSPDARAMIEALTADVDNISAAWNHALDLGDQKAIERAAGGLYRFVRGSGRLSEGLELLRQARSKMGGVLAVELAAYELELSWGFMPIEDSMATYDQVLVGLESDGLRERRARAMVAVGLGQAFTEMIGDVVAARQLFDEARDLLAGMDEPTLDAHVRVAAAKTETTSGSFSEALELLEPSARHYREIGHLDGEANAQSRMAMAYAEQGMIAEALTADLRSLELYQLLGNRSRIADMLLNAGASYVLCGAWDEAERLTREGLSIHEEMAENTMLIPYIWCQLAEIAAGRGDLERAEQLFTAGIRDIRTSGFSLGLRLKLPEWGRFLVQVGRYLQAEVVLEEAATVWGDIGGDHFVATVDATRARALAGHGRDAEAIALARDVWRRTKAGDLRLPYPVETFVDLLVVLGETKPAADIRSIAASTVRRTAAAFADPALRASYLALHDVANVTGA